MNKATCLKCDRPVQARDLCGPHYSTWYRANRQRTMKCGWCGENFKTGRAGVKYCGASCGSKYARSQLEESPKWAAHLQRVASTRKQTPSKKTQGELEELWRGQRSTFRAAYEDGDHQAFLEELEKRCAPTSNGCWEWQGQLSSPKKSSTGYPIIKWRGRTHQVHRLSLEAKLKAPLGSQQSHHTCANTTCVNPSHLEAATHVENIAEMKARRSYENRIEELESALRSIQPNHPTLNRASYGA